MELIGMLLLGVLGIAGAVLVRLLADEFTAWNPRILEKLIECAVRRLPAELRPRFGEEWRSHLNDTPGELGKLLTAIGCWGASQRISRPPRAIGWSTAACTYAFRAMFVLESPLWLILFSVLWLLVRLESRDAALVSVQVVAPNGEYISAYKFRTFKGDDASQMTMIGKWLNRHEFFLYLPLIFYAFNKNNIITPNFAWRVIKRAALPKKLS
jgi:hypothetical protein